jgi:outer membrane protein OmpA-like peptidoglycan-associated protein
MTTASIKSLALVTALGASFAFAGCAHQRDVNLVRAEAAYNTASTDPMVRQHAAAQLHDAEVSLQRAQERWDDDHDRKEMQHLGYVVERQVDIARVTAQKEIAKQEATQLQGSVTQEVLNARENELALLRQELTMIQSRESERGIVLTIPDVLFEVDKADLKASAQRDLAAIASYLKQHPDQKALIEGHTDSTGTEAHNHELSLRRSTAVETFFLRNGVDPNRLEVRGLGEDHPVASNATASGRQQNRRVEIVMLNGGDKTVRTEDRVIEYRR